MADLSKLREELKGISQEMSSVKSNLLAATQQTSDFTTKLAGLSTVSTTGGSIWSAFARFTKGNLFFIQKQVRGFANIAKVVTNIEKERVEGQTKLVELMKKQGQVLETSIKNYMQIDSILSGSNKRTAKAIFLQDSYNKLKIREMGFEEFLTEQKMDALNATKQQLANERKLVDTQKARQKLSAFSKGRIGSRFQTGFFGNPKVEDAIVQLLGIDDEIRGLREGIKLADTDEEKALLQKEVDSRLLMTEVLREELDKLGVIVETFAEAGTTANIRTKDRESLSERFKKFNAKTFSDLVDLAKNALSSYFNKKNFNKIYRFAVTGLMVFGKILYAITLLGLLVFLLHKTGVIDYLMKFFTSENFQKLFGIYVDGLKDILSGIWSIITGIFEIIRSLYTGDTGGIGQGLMSIGEGLISILLGSGKVLLSTILMTLTTVILGGVGSLAVMIGNILEAGFNMIVTGAKKAKEYAPKLGVVGGFIAGVKMGGTAGSIVPGAGTLGGALIGGLGGALIGGLAGSAVQGLSSGGTIGRGGLFMVGEKGPELVNLPAGSAVYNNQQTRSMMGGNTINVHVNGRVGASDAELDDIARKIGRKINLEMNRYNNSGYRA